MTTVLEFKNDPVKHCSPSLRPYCPSPLLFRRTHVYTHDSRPLPLPPVFPDSRRSHGHSPSWWSPYPSRPSCRSLDLPERREHTSFREGKGGYRDGSGGCRRMSRGSGSPFRPSDVRGKFKFIGLRAREDLPRKV